MDEMTVAGRDYSILRGTRADVQRRLQSSIHTADATQLDS